VLLGPVLGRYILRSSFIRHALLLGPVCLGMFLVQRASFPASRHIQWPWAQHRNGWLKAFVWIRENTPSSALFALGPDHMNTSGEDNEGFRAVAERCSPITVRMRELSHCFPHWRKCGIKKRLHSRVGTGSEYRTSSDFPELTECPGSYCRSPSRAWSVLIGTNRFWCAEFLWTFSWGGESAYRIDILERVKKQRRPPMARHLGCRRDVSPWSRGILNFDSKER
jgi:hypothetical protein